MYSVGVLFSGGRDSTLAAKRLFDAGHPITLLSFEGGFGYGGAEIREIRFRELDAVLGPETYKRRLLRIHGLVRRICLVDLVHDIKRDGYQLVLLGEFLAMIVCAIRFARSHGLQALATGVTAYQSHFPEQGPIATEFISRLCGTEMLQYLRPVEECDNVELVKDELLLGGFSTKSLEGSTLFADICDVVPDEVITAYLRAKEPLAHVLLDR